MHETRCWQARETTASPMRTSDGTDGEDVFINGSWYSSWEQTQLRDFGIDIQTYNKQVSGGMGGSECAQE